MTLFKILVIPLLALYKAETSCALTCPSSDNMNSDVLVFGAGIAGLTTARHLSDNGISNIKVLEARSDKIGGRIRSATFAGATIELGANWIQQVFTEESKRDKHPLWSLAKGAEGCVNLVGHFTETAEFWDRNADTGQYYQVDDEATDTLQEQFDEAVEGIESLSEQLRSSGASDITVRTALQREGWNPRTDLEDLVEWHNFDFCFAESPNVSSLFTSYPLLEHPGLGDEDYFVSDQRGLEAFLDCISEGIEPKIQLGVLVNNISWNDDCVCASVSPLSDNEEETVCAKYGVVTFSIGVLQEWINSSQPKFEPQLSTRKQQAINAYRMAYYLKIFLHFNETFWNDGVDDILRTDNQRGYFPSISPIGQLLPGSPSVLIVTVVESEAYRLTFQDQDETIEEIMVVLRQLYGDDIPYPIDILIPTWIKDPLYRGMYSNSAFGLTEQDQIELGQPEGNLYLSGEAVNANYFGFMHGGYCEGLVTADRILEAEGISNPTSTLPSCPSAQPSQSVVVKGIVSVVVTALIYFWMVAIP